MEWVLCWASGPGDGAMGAVSICGQTACRVPGSGMVLSGSRTLIGGVALGAWSGGGAVCGVGVHRAGAVPRIRLQD